MTTTTTMPGTSSICWILSRLSRRNETEFMTQESYRQPQENSFLTNIYGFFINIENKLMAFQHLRIKARASV